jgi:ribosome-associated protein
MSENLKTFEANYSTKITANPDASRQGNAPDQVWQLVNAIAAAAEDRKGADPVILKVSEVSYLADYFVFITGFSRVQVRAIAGAIQEKVATQLQRHPRRTEGEADGTWVLIDYGDAIIHILMPKEREFYNLEAFWGHAERIELPAS